MSEWGLNPATVAAAGTVVAALALVVAIVGAYAEGVRRSRERNLHAFLAMSGDIRQRWESRWATLLRDEIPRSNPEELLNGPLAREVEFMLNWLDWLGLALKLRLIDHRLVVGSLGPMIREVLCRASIRIESDMADPAKGPDWWANVLYLARLPQIGVDVAKEAAAIRERAPEGIVVDRPR